MRHNHSNQNTIVHKLKKHKKKCSSSSSSSSDSCRTEPTFDCCLPQYQRLDKYRTLSVSLSLENVTPDYSTATNRSGCLIPAPNADGVTGPIDTCVSPNSAYYGATNPVVYKNTESPSSNLPNAYLAYYFVNVLRYIPYEDSKRCDQVWGWYVNTTNGNLQLFQVYENVPTNVIRLDLLNLATPTPLEKKQLKSLNYLFKLSKKAIKEVHKNPKEEGEFVQLCDKHGQEWLLVINYANANGSVLTNPKDEFVVVATKL